jgi:hypothetical protein
VNSWFKGIAMGPDAARIALEADVDQAVDYRSNQVLRKHKGQDDTFFALVEYKYKSKVLGDPRVNVGYSLMEMDVMYDDTVLKVMAIHERKSLAPEDVSVIASLDSAHDAGNATPFPEDDLTDYPHGLNNETVLANTKAWCQARSSGQPESVLDRVLDPSFRLWDAYGVLPVLCDPSKRGAVDACVVPYHHVKDIIKQTKERYNIKCKMIDNAVSLSKNVGFTHWRSRIVNKSNNNAFEIEAVEVDLFGKDGKLKDIWMFRDPMDVEVEMLQQGK